MRLRNTFFRGRVFLFVLGGMCGGMCERGMGMSERGCVNV